MGRVVRRRGPSAVAAVAVALLLTGCGGSGPTRTVAGDDGADPAVSQAAANEAADGTSGVAGDEESTAGATLPPGDPGADAPGTDDPNGDLGDGTSSDGTSSDGEDSHDAGHDVARPSVPADALLDADTVGAVAGGSWVAAAAPADSCAFPRPAGAVASRSAQLTSPAAGGTAERRIVQTVATHNGSETAVAAVAAVSRRLQGCGSGKPTDPRIGDASVQTTVTGPGGASTLVTAVAVEGVTFVLSGSGPVTAADSWAALADIALGSTCSAAADGCH